MFLLAIALMAAGLVFQSAKTASAATTYKVNGQVFRDFNNNGAKDVRAVTTGIANDVGLAGVTVKGYDGKNALVGTTTTIADGTYSLTVTDPFTTAVRVEFTGLPDGYESSFHGANSGTSVQFIKVGPTPVAKVDFAVNVPEDFSQGVAPIVSAMNSAGLRSHAGNVGKPSLVSVPWTVARNDSTPGNYTKRTKLASVDQTGSLWGSAFSAKTGDLFAAATMRRHSDLGPLGLGGIYRLGNALNSDGTINTAAAGKITQWLDVSSPSGLNINVGETPTNRGLGAPAAPTRDQDALAKVGRVGIGGIAVSSDGSTLYFVNLFDRKVYAINIANKTLVGSYDLGLVDGERPWALEVHRGKVYVGYVQTGETFASEPLAEQLYIRVKAAPESSLSTLADPSAVVLTHDLGYKRGEVRLGVSQARFTKWHGWDDSWTMADLKINPTQNNSVSWGQPSLSDLQFSTQGDMILGIQDRFPLQMGDDNFGSDVNDNALYGVMSQGDTLIAGPNSSGGFTLENNGKVTTVANGVATTRTTTHGSANEGPDGAEFFQDTNIYHGQNGADDTVHKENTLGALATLAGVEQVVSTTFDPLSTLRSSGLTWFGTAGGAVAKGYQHTDDGSRAAAVGNFEKGGGLGDIQVLANAAPLEIGNRVWYDADQDGIQDADEPAIGGVSVKLFAADPDGKPTGTAISTATTNAAGEYYFDADPDKRYVVVFAPPTTGNWVSGDARFGTIPWANMSFTTIESSNSTVGSNPDKFGNAVVETGGPGQNDHTIDAGLIANVPFTVQKLRDPSGGAATSDQEFTINFSGKDFRGEAVGPSPSSATLAVNATSPQAMVPVGSSVKITEANSANYAAVTITAPGQTPDSDGYYRVNAANPAFAFTVTNKLFNPGKFKVTKTVTGGFSLADSAMDDVEFTVHYSSDAGSGDLVLKKSNDWTLESPNLPKGTVVTLTEPTITGKPVDVAFGTPVWSGGTGAGTPANSTTLTIGDGTTVAIGLANPSTPVVGGFDLTKVVTGVGEGSVPTDFEFIAEYSLDNGDSWIELDPVTKGNQVDGPSDIPLGTRVLIREQTPGNVAGVDWISTVFSGAGVTAAVGNTPASFVIDDETQLSVTMTNSTEQQGKFKVTKSVSGGFDLDDPALAGVEFTVHYAYTGGSGNLVLKQSNDWVLESPELPVGTVVTLTEPTITGKPVNVAFGTPVWTGGSGPGTPPNSTTLTIGDGTTVAISLTNPSTPLVGGFNLTKTVTGTGASSVPTDFEFVAEYSVDGGDSWIELDPVTKGNQVTGPSNIPVGTKVLVREKAPTAIAGTVWVSALFSGTGVTPAVGNTPASFTIGSVTQLSVTLTNATEKPGKFSVTKSVNGDFTLINPALADVEFTVHYSYSDGSGDLVLKKSNGWSHESPELPIGTVVTLTEPTIANAPANVEFGDPVWSGGTGPGTPENSTTLTIGDGTNIAVSLLNPSTQLVGGFNVTKAVTGTGDGLVPDDFEFIAEYSVDGGDSWIELDPVTKGHQVNGPDDIPAGTTVLIREKAPAPITDVAWASPVFSGAGVTAAAGNTPASFVIDAETQLSVTMTNPTKTPGKFKVIKNVTGGFSLDDALLAAVEFTVHYEYSGGSGDLVLNAENGWEVESPDLPLGTVVTLTETSINNTPPNVEFETPVWAGGDGPGEPDNSRKLTIGDGTTVAIGLRNPSTPLVGGFSVAKSVTGTGASMVPTLFQFIAEYSLDGGTNWIELDPVTKGRQVSGPDDIPTGTKVLIREKAPSVITGMTWLPAVFSGTGVTAATDTEPASFVIGNGTNLAVALTNPTQKPGKFNVIKNVTGDFSLDDPLLSGVEFTVHYAHSGGSGDLVLKKSNGWTLDSPSLPVGTVVTLTEPTISNAPANLGFEDPVWAGGDGPGTEDNSRQLTIGDDTTVQIGLRNPSIPLVGGFGVTKSVVGVGADRVPDDFEFVAEYSLDDGETWIPLDPVTKADSTVAGPDDLPAGTKVLIREVAPAKVTGVNWVSAVFSGTGVTPATDEEPASFVIAADTQLSVTLTNSTEKRDGQFTITKHVVGPGASLLKGDPEFTVNWTLNGVAQTPIKVKNGTFFTSAPIIEDSVVTFAEAEVSGTLLPNRASWGTPVFTMGDETYANGDEITIGASTTPFEITLDNYADVEPEVEIRKGDGDAPKAEIVHEADTVHEGEFYTDGETRDIVIRVLNPGPEPLREVELSDVTRAGGEIVDLNWAFPDGSSTAATYDAKKSKWTARWAATYEPGTTKWAVGDYIVGTAKLTVDAPRGLHQNVVRVDAVGALSGKPVDDDNPYNSFTAKIQVIKYDGNKPDPAIKDGDGNWITPVKPMTDAMQDANDVKHSVPYVANKRNKVRWVVTNTGPTTLTNLTLKDLTGAGPDIGSDWTADLSAFGGSSKYSFVKDGTWKGLFPPGASFFAEGTLKLPSDTVHQDTVTVTGNPVIPEENEDGTPSDRPWIGEDGKPVLARDSKGKPVVLTDDDPFNAHTPKGTTPPGIERGREELPNAGAGMGPLAPLGGLLLLVAGTCVVLSSRRRRS